jgi:large subunit ribosomal protein L1
MSKHGKKYRAAAEKVDRDRNYEPKEAIALAKETSTTNFDATVELHIRLGVDPRHADQQVRDVVVLPHGLGKSVRVIVFAQGEGATLAREAGADIVADDDETLKKIQDGWTEFDVAVATVDKTANLHIPIGKVSFEEAKLFDNMAVLMDAIKKSRPPATKGTYIRRVTLTTTMGPGIKVDPNQAQAMDEEA